MNDFWIPFSIVVATALFNALFYILIKSDSDKKLESYKAAYSGVFEKKLNIYIELLESLDKLKEMTIDYGHAGNKSIYTPEEIRTEFNRFIRKKNNGAIFYSDDIVAKFEKLQIEIQGVYDLSYKNAFIDKLKQPVEFKDFGLYLEALTNLTKSTNYSELKKDLVISIRKDFNL